MDDVDSAPLRPIMVQLPTLPGSFLAWSEGESWEGYAVPLFTLEVGKAIVEAHAQTLPGLAAYDADEDAFTFARNEGDEPESYGPEARVLGDRVEKLYPIGAGHWRWAEVTP